MNIVDESGRTVGTVGGEDDKEGRLYHHLNRLVSFYEPFLFLVLKKIFEQLAPAVEDLLDYFYEVPAFLESAKPLIRAGLSAYLAKDFLKAIHVLIPQIEKFSGTFWS